MAIKVFSWVDKNGNRIDHNPELKSSDDHQNLSAEVVVNNPSPTNVVGVAESIPNEQIQVQTANSDFCSRTFAKF